VTDIQLEKAGVRVGVDLSDGVKAKKESG